MTNLKTLDCQAAWSEALDDIQFHKLKCRMNVSMGRYSSLCLSGLHQNCGTHWPLLIPARHIRTFWHAPFMSCLADQGTVQVCRPMHPVLMHMSYVTLVKFWHRQNVVDFWKILEIFGSCKIYLDVIRKDLITSNHVRPPGKSFRSRGKMQRHQPVCDTLFRSALSCSKKKHTSFKGYLSLCYQC